MGGWEEMSPFNLAADAAPDSRLQIHTTYPGFNYSGVHNWVAPLRINSEMKKHVEV